MISASASPNSSAIFSRVRWTARSSQWLRVMVCSSALVTCALPAAAFAKDTDVDPNDVPGRCRNLTFQQLPGLRHEVARGNLHIHYATEGPDALSELGDFDGNGIPDRIDDLALQLTTAREVYDQLLHLTPPLMQPRYQSAQRINVFVLALDGGNGRAFDEVVSERSPNGGSLPCGIKVFIDRNVEPSTNITPAHELFHLYQYGYSMFKSRWYLEGMTRWIETLFIPDNKIKRDASRRPHTECADIFDQSYAASAYWRQQGLSTGETPLKLPAEMLALRYRDGRKVIDASPFIGAFYLRRTLQELSALSTRTSRARGLPNYNWPEDVQKSNRFDAAICKASQP